MPSKKKKYNARFPPARIKKIMQTDEDVGKVAAAVPVIISRALELFIDSLIEKTASVTRSKNAKTLSSSHVKQAIHSEKMFDFLRDLVKNVPDHQTEEEMETAAPSGSGVVEKKQKAPRPRKPREEGSRGRGRPRKLKVEEKRDSDSEGSDEETETDEEQTADEDSQPPQHLNNPAQGDSSTCISSQEESNTQMMFQEQCGSQDTFKGQCSGAQVTEGQCDVYSNQMQLCDGRNVPQGTAVQPDFLMRKSQSEGLPKPPGQIPPQSEDHGRPPPLINNAQVEITNTQQPPQTSSQHNIPALQQFPQPGFPMHNMMFSQYPYMGGGQPMQYLHQQPHMSGLPPSSTPGSSAPQQPTGTVPPQFIPGHPAFMMPPLAQNGPMMPIGLGMSGLPMGPPPPLVPISTVKNIPESENDTNVPLDMSLAGKSRSQTSTTANPPLSLSQIPVPLGMQPLHTDVQSPLQSDMHQLPHPQGFPQWRMNSQINQNFQETGIKSQILGPPPLISSTVTQSTASVTENGKHKQSDDSTEISSKKQKQKNASGNPGEQKTVSFPDLANIMNAKPVKPVQNEDDDYDT